MFLKTPDGTPIRDGRPALCHSHRSAPFSEGHSQQDDKAMMASARWERVHAGLKVIWQIYAGGKFIDLSSLVVLPRTTSRPAVPIAPIQPPAAVLPKAPASVISVS